MNRR
jgi:putative tryptophan/tyrosine transport system substrate-binding protein